MIKNNKIYKYKTDISMYPEDEEEKPALLTIPKKITAQMK